MQPDITGYTSVIGALMELSTERPSGMGPAAIPITSIWAYMDRFGLPDWYEPVLLQADSRIVAASNEDLNSGGSGDIKANR